ncbi:hypothetical protein CsatB_008282 [Cannabis sativa]|uniref:uncharacterized protein LOC133032358 n=1 Tax=Cannabis sativa TaxID=3483 RepID=UPI0029C9EF36|nr:uncharacterized protein LOC133032358 [Cannabis sativa]
MIGTNSYGEVEINLAELPSNPGLRTPILEYDLNVRDQIRRAYLQKINVITKDIGDKCFSVLVDESRDVSMNEKIVVVLRYVDKNGLVIERFIGVEHVTSTTSLSLKDTIDKMMNDSGSDSFLAQVSLFCEIHELEVPKMDGIFKASGKSRHKSHEMTNLYYFRVDLFYSVIDQQLQELNDRFNKRPPQLIIPLSEHYIGRVTWRGRSYYNLKIKAKFEKFRLWDRVKEFSFK